MTQGHISERLSTREDKLLLLDYLLTELMAARMLHEKVPEKKIELKLVMFNVHITCCDIIMKLSE